ncbi:MAG TPA: ABC transporter substrate-binding protein [Geminicoccaceae bacterium]|nr:ABC transporter substrate-binding protein [Geminicoccaceae bacterium]
MPPARTPSTSSTPAGSGSASSSSTRRPASAGPSRCSARPSRSARTCWLPSATRRVGAYNGSQWSNDLDNPINRRFVDAFKAKYGRLPLLYASQGYDTALILDAALDGGGGLADKDAFRDSLRKVSIETSRGGFRFNSNHFPIQDYYVRQVVKLDDGTLTNRLVGKVFDDHADAYAAECGMK